MKIAFISTILSYPWGGADTLWTGAAEAAVERGDSVLLAISPLTASNSRVAAMTARGALLHLRVPPSPPTSLLEKLGRKLGNSPSTDPLLANLKQFQPDLVIFSLGGTYDLTLHPLWFKWLLATKTKFQLIANYQPEHPTLSESNWKLAREILAAADQNNFVSERNLATTRRHLLQALPNARVIQNPLRWCPTDISPWPKTGPRLATVSRLDEGKGIQLLLHAAADACRSEPDWELRIYGQGPAENYLRATTESLGLAERVKFCGYVADLRSIWSENQLMCSPAIDDGVPMTIPEAMLCQRPVLATCVGGAEDWLQHGKTGFLCPAPTVPLLAATLQHALQQFGAWQSMGVTAGRAAQDRYLEEDYLRLIG